MASYTREQVKDLISRAAMGDEEATDLLAEHMTSVTPDGVVNYVGEKIEGAAAGEWFKRNYSDVWSDDELRTQANKLDIEMLKRHPGMSTRARYGAVGETIRKRYGPDADRAAAIAHMQARRRQHLADSGSIEDEEQVDIENDRSAAIAEMAEARKGRPGPTPEERQRYQDEADRRKRMAEG